MKRPSLARALMPLLIAGAALAPEHGEARFCPEAPHINEAESTEPIGAQKIATYNIKTMSISPRVIVDVIRSMEADIVLLQEVNSENIKCLESNFPEYNVYFSTTMPDTDPPYGLAILSTAPLEIDTYPLPPADGEPRIVMVGHHYEFAVANTHLATNHEARSQQFRAIAPVLGAMSIDVFGGDFNSELHDPDFVAMRSELGLRAQVVTTPTLRSGRSIDHLLAVEDFDLSVVVSVGSDHNPALMELQAP